MTWGTGDEPAGSAARARPRKSVPRLAGSTPWAELHCHSSYSFLDGAATPGELVAEAARLGLEVLALTDHDGMYGVPQFAQAAARLGDHGTRLGTVFGAELSLGLPSGQASKAPDPPGPSPAGAGPRPGRLPAAVRRDQRRPAGGRGEGPPRLRPERAGRRARRPLGGADRVPQGAGARRARRGRSGGRLAGAEDADRDVRARERDGRADLPARPGRRRAQRHAGPAGGARRPRRGGHRQRPLRGARAGPARPGAGRDPGPAQPDRHGRLAARGGHRLPALWGGDESPAQPVPGRPRAHRRTRPPVRVRLHGDRPSPARLRCPGRAHRSLLAARAGRQEGPGPLRAARRRTGARRVLPDRQGARRDRAAGVRRLLPDRAQHRRVLRGQRHLVPGPRIGGEFGGLLRARHHQRRPGLAPPAVRAVPVRRPGRAAGHRPGHRAPPPRGGHPVRLPPVRPGPGRPGRQRDLVPAADGAAGRRAGAGVQPADADAWTRGIGPGPAVDGEALPAGRPPPWWSWRPGCSGCRGISASTRAAW